MPTNLYGPGDSYDLNNSHVLPALIRKLHKAKTSKSPTVVLWGSGKPKREFLYVDDLANALLFLANLADDQYEKLVDSTEWPLINIGTGRDQTILEMAEIIAQVVGYQDKFVLDPDKPDGTMRKVLDVSKMRKLGWEATTNLTTGIELTYREFLKLQVQS